MVLNNTILQGIKSYKMLGLQYLFCSKDGVVPYNIVTNTLEGKIANVLPGVSTSVNAYKYKRNVYITVNGNSNLSKFNMNAKTISYFPSLPALGGTARQFTTKNTCYLSKSKGLLFVFWLDVMKPDGSGGIKTLPITT